MASSFSPRKSHARVLLLQRKDSGYCRAVMFGALRYVESKGLNWNIQHAPPTREVIDPLLDWKPDGVIAHTTDPDFTESLLATGVTVVSTTYAIPGLPIPVFDVDHQQVGRIAADYFLERGYEHFAFFGSGESLFSTERERGFRERLLSRNEYEVSSFHAEVLPLPLPGASWAELDREAGDWLRALPKPIAVLVSNDSAARRLLELCHRMELSVPGEVAVLGVDNDESECRMATPTLSSISLPSERIGFLAAERLNELLSGEKKKRKKEESPHLIEPLYCIARQSTDAQATDDPVVRRALNAIREGITEGVSVGELAGKVGVSRRLLERKFKTQLDSTILEQIHRAHIDLAKRMLMETDLPVNVIADRCGLQSTRRLNMVFKKVTQTTPREMRRKMRASG